MGQRRLSREELRQQTCERLLEAASRVIPEKGYQATSIEDISSEAGYSRGAFYSNFADKDALFYRLLEVHCENEQQMLSEMFDQRGGLDELRQQLGEYYALTCTENRQFILYTEAQIHALRNDDFRQKLITLQRSSGERIAGLIQRYFEAQGRQLDVSRYDDIATGLMALSTGIGFAQMLDKEGMDNQRVMTVLMTFFDAVSA